MKKDKIQILVKPKCDSEIREKLLERFEEKCNFLFADETPVRDFDSVEVIIGEPDKEEIDRYPQLKWIQLTWAGADKYTKMKDFPDKLLLTNASGAFGKIISEYVIGNLIALYRSFPFYWENKQHHIWKEKDSADTIYGKNVLILGTGDIGKNIASRLQAFGTRITGVKRNASSFSLQEGFDRVYSISMLDELLPEMDIVISCLPDTEETRGLLTFKRLESMKKAAVLVNVGRGSLVRNEDLEAVLEQGHLKGVIMDVSETEPLPSSSSLWDRDNVIITPHIAGPSAGENKTIQGMIWNICMENLECYLKGEKLVNIVLREKGY